jgi:hypothetical protein
MDQIHGYESGKSLSDVFFNGNNFRCCVKFLNIRYFLAINKINFY